MTNFKEKKFLPVPVVQQKQDYSQNEFAEEVQEDYEAENASVEVIRILVKIDSRTEPQTKSEVVMSKIRTVGKNGNEFTVRLNSRDLADVRSWKTAISAVTANLDIPMKEKDFRELKQKWYENAKNKNIFACAGSQNGQFIWANAIYDFATQKLTYAQKIDETKTYDSVENSLVEMNNTCRPMLYPVERTSEDVFREFFTTLYRTFPKSEVLVCFGMALGTIFWDIFQKKAEGVPPIFFIGESHSGKSTIVKTISAIFGLCKNSDFMSGNSTPYAIMQELYSRMNIPVFIEELPPEIFGKLTPAVKNIYNAISRGRGKKDGVEKTKILTNLVSTSNHFFKDISLELLSRIAFVNMKKGEFNLENFPYFDVEKRKELSQILPVFLRYRKGIVLVYKSIYGQLNKHIPEKGRHISNLAISCTMWYLVNSILKYPLVNLTQMVIDYNNTYKCYLNAEIKSSDVILNDITRMVEAGRLEYGRDWKLVESTLKLNLRKYVEKFNIFNPKEMTTPAQIRLQVANDKRFDTKTIPQKDIGRAISIDIAENSYLLEKLQNQQRVASVGWYSLNNEKEKKDEK